MDAKMGSLHLQNSVQGEQNTVQGDSPVALGGAARTSVWRRLALAAALAAGSAEATPGQAQANVRYGTRSPVVSPNPNDPQFGGTVVVAGPYIAEVLLRPNGWLEAFVARRASLARLPKDLELKLTVQTTRRKSQEVQLNWDPLRRVFAGALSGGDKPTRGAVSMTLKASGKSYRGANKDAAVVPAGHLGGVVVAAGSHTLEIRPHRNGFIEVIPRTSGVSAKHYEALKLTLGVRGRNGQPYVVQTRWHQGRARFVGRTPLGIRLSSGPLDLSLHQNGKVYRGGMHEVAAIPRAELGGSVMISGNHTVEVRRAGGRRIEAIVLDRKGHEPAHHKIQLIMNVVDTDGSSHPIPMMWDTRGDVYAGYIYIEPERVVRLTSRVRTGDMVKAEPFGPMLSWVGSTRFSFPSSRRIHAEHGRSDRARGRAQARSGIRPPQRNRSEWDSHPGGQTTRAVTPVSHQAPQAPSSAGAGYGSAIQAGGGGRGDMSSGLAPGID